MTDECHLFKAGCAMIGIYSQGKVVASHCEISKTLHSFVCTCTSRELGKGVAVKCRTRWCFVPWSGCFLSSDTETDSFPALRGHC